MTLSIVLPCFNEEAVIASTINDVLTWMEKRNISGEVIVVDDGSKDRSCEIIEPLLQKHENLKLLKHAQNRGAASAVFTGLDAAQSEYIGYMDSDGQFRAKEFDALLPHLEKYNVVIGRRTPRADVWIRRAKGRLFSWLLFLTLGIRVSDPNCGVKILKRSLWPQIRPVHATGGLLFAEVYLHLNQMKIPWKEVPVLHEPRCSGRGTGGKVSVAFVMLKELLELEWARLWGMR